jgi:hypothetical protein
MMPVMTAESGTMRDPRRARGLILAGQIFRIVFGRSKGPRRMLEFEAFF